MRSLLMLYVNEAGWSTLSRAQLDGPFADSKAQPGGFYPIDVPDLDAALSWAARCPAAGHGVVERRALQGTSGNGSDAAQDSDLRRL